MFSHHRLIGSSLFVLLLFSTALGQENRAPVDTPREPVPVATAPLVTATATSKRVRFVSPGSVVQLRLEVYNEAGQKLFDTELRGGNVLDWLLQDGAGERVSSGSYACVLTIKSLSGRINQRVGLVTLNDEKAAVEAAATGELSLAQQQTIGPVEGSAGFTVLQQSEAEALTSVTHDGTKGQVSRTSGPLSFRVGDVFSGKDKEQMRLTEDGRLGIGTSDPQAKLDVAGTIRAERVVIAKPISKQGQPGLPSTPGSDNQTASADTAQAPDDQPLATGSGTLNRVAKWTETGGAGTLGDTQITESNGSVVVGNAGQTGNIQIYGTALQDVFAGMGTDINVGPAFNYGYAGQSFGRSAGFFNVRPDALATPPNPSLRFMTANVQRMIVTNTGDVGIGTSNPAAKLHVAGNGRFAGDLTITGALNATLSGNGSGLTNLNAGNITTGTLDNARLGVVPTDKGGTGLSAAGAAGNFLRSNGTGWTSSALVSADIPAGSGNYIQNNPATQQSGSFNIDGDGTLGGTLSANAVTTPVVNGLSSITGEGAQLLNISRRVHTFSEFYARSGVTTHSVDNESGAQGTLFLGTMNSRFVQIGGTGTSGNTSSYAIYLQGNASVSGTLSATLHTRNIDTPPSFSTPPEEAPLSIGLSNATAINLFKPTTISGLLTASNGISTNTASISGDLTVGGTINGTVANANDAANLGGVAASEYVRTNDGRLSDARNPLPNSGNYIQNNPVEQQSGGFNISGGGTLGGTLTAEEVNFTGLRTEANATSPNVIGGHGVNSVTTGVEGATISGGGFSGAPNRVTDNYGTVGGGVRNTAGDNAGTTSDRLYATVGGGNWNTASGLASTVGGGANNTAIGGYSTVGGGSSNTANNANSTVGGGESNTATGGYSTVGGGFGNIASGSHSTVPGGQFNTAQGHYSLAVGRRANALHQGSFVWSDATTADLNFFSSTADNQFLINATGGVGIGTNAPGARLHVSGAGVVRARVDSDANAGLALTLNNQPGWSVATVSGGNFQIFNDAIGQNAVWIDAASNNVGIGTTPSHKLHVNGTVAGVGPYVDASDLRYKRDIRPIGGALSKVLSLRGVTFDWRREEFPALDFSSGRTVGFIAQEVERVVPEAVTRDAEGFRSVAYSHLTPVLVEAVKEQQQTIIELRRQNSALDARLREQAARLDALERAASTSAQSPR